MAVLRVSSMVRSANTRRFNQHTDRMVQMGGNSAPILLVCMIFVPPHAMHAMDVSTAPRPGCRAAFSVLASPLNTKQWPLLEANDCRKRALNSLVRCSPAACMPSM
eukprot:655743-Rhodomonas_salina.1